MQGVTAECLHDPTELEKLRAAWADIGSQGASRAGSHEDYRNLLDCAPNHDAMCLVVLRENGTIVTLAPFVLSHGKKAYDLGSHPLFSLPVRRMSLMNDCLVGRSDSGQMRRVFEALARRGGFDLVSFDEHELDGPFMRSLKDALTDSPWRWVNPFHKTSVHWFIDLPSSFEAYMAALSPKTRQTLRRKLGKFDKEHNGRVRLVTDPEDVEWFLTVGEKISRMTYQWKVGQRLCFDEPTLRTYLSNAKAGTLRCFVLMMGDEPCAFLRGNIRDGVYDFETPGYNPIHEKASPGTVLLLRVVEDLIANTECRVFDFGIGGDYVGYKKVLGNRSYDAVFVEVARRWGAYPMLLFGIQDALNMAKRCGNALLKQSRLKRLLKKRLRGG